MRWNQAYEEIRPLRLMHVVSQRGSAPALALRCKQQHTTSAEADTTSCEKICSAPAEPATASKAVRMRPEVNPMIHWPH